MSPTTTIPALWLDGDQIAYSDAGVTAAASPYGRVAQIAQPSPLSGNWTASGNGRPWKEANSLDFHYSDSPQLTQPASASIPANNCTIAISWQNRGGQLNTSPFSVPLSGGGNLSIYFLTGVMYIVAPTIAGGAFTIVPGIAVPVLLQGHLVVQCTLLLTCTATQYEIRLTVNGVSHSTIIATAPPSGTLGTIQLGRSSSAYNAHMAVSQFLAYSMALDSTEQGALQTYLLAKPAGNPPTTAPLIAILGDSIGAAWIPGFQASLNSYAPRVIGAGAAGTTTGNPAQIPAFFDTDVHPHFSASRAKNIVVCEGISVNDLGFAIGAGPSAAASAVIASYSACCAKVKAAGWITVACTLSPNTGGADYETARGLINTSIRANYLSYAHYLADLGAAPGMSDPSDVHGPNFADGVHVGAAGYLIWDTTLLTVLTAALRPGTNLKLSKLYNANTSPPTYVFALPD
jgi:hypothetical protein